MEPLYEQVWKRRHLDAMAHPSPAEEPVVTLLGMLYNLADEYGNDYVVLKALEHLASAIVVLLNTDIGRLDPGTIDSEVRNIISRVGGDADEI